MDIHGRVKHTNTTQPCPSRSLISEPAGLRNAKDEDIEALPPRMLVINILDTPKQELQVWTQSR